VTPISIGMHWNAPLSPMKEGARAHRSYGSYAPSTYGSYEPLRENPSTAQALSEDLIFSYYVEVCMEGCMGDCIIRDFPLANPSPGSAG
jgi:hypothetical protein